MATSVTPRATSQSSRASRSGVVVPNSCTISTTRPCSPGIRAQAVISAWWTSSPAHRSTSCSMRASLPPTNHIRCGRSRGGCARCYETARRALVATVRGAVSLRVRLLIGLVAPRSVDVATSGRTPFSSVVGGRRRRPCVALDYSSVANVVKPDLQRASQGSGARVRAEAPEATASAMLWRPLASERQAGLLRQAPIVRFLASLFEGLVAAAERLAAGERGGSRVRRFDDHLWRGVDEQPPLLLGLLPPEHEYGACLLGLLHDSVRERFPAHATVGAGGAFAHRQRRVDEQHATACPTLEIAVTGICHMRVLRQLWVLAQRSQDVPERRRQLLLL